MASGTLKGLHKASYTDDYSAWQGQTRALTVTATQLGIPSTAKVIMTNVNAKEALANNHFINYAPYESGTGVKFWLYSVTGGVTVKICTEVLYYE